MKLTNILLSINIVISSFAVYWASAAYDKADMAVFQAEQGMDFTYRYGEALTEHFDLSCAVLRHMEHITPSDLRQAGC